MKFKDKKKNYNMDNFKKESERIADICFMLHKREIEIENICLKAIESNFYYVKNR
jgi:hypothetical protein